MAATALAVLALAGCGVTPPSPAELAGNTVQKYMNALAAGYYTKACSVLNGRTRASLGGPPGSRITCEKVLARCLPYNATVAKRDQSQLLYANVQVRIEHSKARADVSGTAVARKIREVTLAHEGGSWQLTSYGTALKGCVTRAKANLVRS
jgi:hypothetical protein